MLNRPVKVESGYPMRKIHIVIIDYGMGNLQSVSNALELLGCHVQVSGNPSVINGADALVLPGVGAFGEAMNNLVQMRLVEPLRNAILNDGKPMLGICLGMQLLADESDERGVTKGLSLISGHVRSIPAPKGFRLPHVGWNGVTIKKQEPLFHDLKDGDAFYFVHSYHFECDLAYIAGVADYGVDVTAALQKGRIFAVQFHPERSQHKGLRLLRNFINFVENTIPESATSC